MGGTGKNEEAAKLWTPDRKRVEAANVTRFIEYLAKERLTQAGDFKELYAWSIAKPEPFWEAVWKFCEVRASQPFSRVLEQPDRMPGAKWFPGARLNFAENLLRYRDDQPAIVFWGESKVVRRLTYREVFTQVQKVAQALETWGIKPGDRIAAFMPNMPETIIAMLAATSLGAVWSTCSPDFGVHGVIDRFGQITPRILFTADGYFFKDQSHDSLAKVKEIASQIPSLEKIVVCPYLTDKPNLSALEKSLNWNELLTSAPSGELKFVQLPADHPLYIMYSSGTTGAPKCIIHSAGGTLIEHLKELILHTDLKREDHFFYQTTCGWMMWHWLVSGLAAGATLILYDGAPFHHEGKILWELAEKERISIFGSNAKYIAALEKDGHKPGQEYDLSALKAVLSTGSPLLPESFDYVYRDIKSDLCLSSIAGGTDIIGCFGLGSPTLPVYRSELQTRSLGTRVEVYDDHGKSIVGERGELVCTAPFPSMPISYWNDPSGEKYLNAYFRRYPNIWHHGDYVELTKNGGLIFLGRSDTVLKPGGIRIGTSEIYRQVESCPEVLESLVVGQEWEGDVRVVLFVRLKEGVSLNDALRDQIKKVIRKNTTAFHVPKIIIQVSDIPRTRSGKLVEIAVRDVIHGRQPKNLEALANPEALDLFRNLPELLA